MRSAIFLKLTMFCSLASAGAKTDISVGRFTDNTENGRCVASTSKAKVDIDRELQEQLIAGLLQLERFQIQEREIRRLQPQHTIRGSLRMFEVCPTEGRGQAVQIAIDVQLLNSKDGLTHMFSSQAQASSTAAGRAPAMAINAAVVEIIKRVDDAVPRRLKSGLPGMRKRKHSDDSGLSLKLVRRERR